MEKVCEIKNLCKKYGKNDFYSISNINIDVNAGEIVGLLGKNGAGKSTTIKCLTGFTNFQEGSISICGHDIVNDPLKAKQNLGYVPDNRAMFEKMTGLEYLNFIADIHDVSIKDREERIKEFQEVFKLDKAINRIIMSYSHGMKQKICLMASLIHYPKLWLLDEPITGLDPQTAKALRDYMQVYKNKGNAVLYSSHNLDAVEKTCDRVYIISNGSIAHAIDIKQFKKENPNKSLEDAFIEEFEN